MTPIVVPAVGESISEVQISQWLKKEGEWVAAGTDLVDLETEKASVQVSAPVDGILLRILKPNDQFAAVGEAIAEFQPAAKSAASAPSAPAPAAGPASPAQPAVVATAGSTGSNGDVRVMPAARRMAGDLGMSPESIPGTGPGGRVLKEDVANASSGRSVPAVAPVVVSPAQAPVVVPAATSIAATSIAVQQGSQNRSEEVKPMSMIRRTIATRLVRAQHEAALLTTFNEVDMQPVMQLRNK